MCLCLSAELDKASSYFLGRKNNICCHCCCVLVWVCVPASHYCPEEHVLLHPDFSGGISGSQPASMPLMSCRLMQALLASLTGMQTEGGFKRAAFWFCERWCTKFVHISSLFPEVSSFTQHFRSLCHFSPWNKFFGWVLFCWGFCFLVVVLLLLLLFLFVLFCFLKAESVGWAICLPATNCCHHTMQKFPSSLTEVRWMKWFFSNFREKKSRKQFQRKSMVCMVWSMLMESKMPPLECWDLLS